MRPDIDYVDCESDNLVDDLLFLTPTHARGFSRKRLTDSITLYYRFESHFVFYYVVRSFDSQGAKSPRSLPILFYWHESMLSTWEKLKDDDDCD